jgi:regulatory protein
VAEPASSGSAEPADPAREAFEKAVGALGQRERTVAELESWLAARGYEAHVIDNAIGRLTEIGELDDERFARRYAEDKRDLRGWGAERIREALQHRGVAPVLIEAALAGESHETEVERATGLLAQRGRGLADEAGRASALAYLTRRGYDYDIAYDAIRRAERGRRAA